MTFHWLIPFFAVIILATCNGAIVAAGRSDKVKYSLLYFNTSLVIWACIDILLWVNKTTNEYGVFFEKLMSLFWLSIGFLFLNFVFALLNKKRNLVYHLAWLSAVVLIFISFFSNKIIAGIEAVYWGVFPVLGDWILLTVGIVIIPMLYGLFLIGREVKLTRDKNLKKIYRVIIITSITTISIDSIFDIFLPAVFSLRLISMATFGNSLLSAVFLYIINKYRFLELSTEEFSKIIFDKVEEGVIITTDNGEIVMQNNAADRLMVINGNDIRMIIKQAQSGERIIKSKVKEGEMGESFYLNIVNSSLTARDGRVLRLFLLNDVSDLVKLKNSLRDKNEEMRITLFRIGHDIKGPAFAIKQLVSLSKLEPGSVNEFLQKIELSVDQLIRFNSEVEQLIRIKELEPNKQKIDIENMIYRCWEELNYFKQNGLHTLELDISGSEFVSDSSLIHTILLNAMSNAIKYNDIRNKGINKIKISSVCSGDKVEISVRDNGLGMDAATVQNVFKLFFRGNTDVGGSGLGMHLVKHAVNKLHGKVFVESKPDEGTCFTFQLPLL